VPENHTTSPNHNWSKYVVSVMGFAGLLLPIIVSGQSSTIPVGQTCCTYRLPKKSEQVTIVTDISAEVSEVNQLKASMLYVTNHGDVYGMVTVEDVTVVLVNQYVITYDVAVATSFQSKVTSPQA
jgi:hypothetical protein